MKGTVRAFLQQDGGRGDLARLETEFLGDFEDVLFDHERGGIWRTKTGEDEMALKRAGVERGVAVSGDFGRRGALCGVVCGLDI